MDPVEEDPRTERKLRREATEHSFHASVGALVSLSRARHRRLRAPFFIGYHKGQN